MSDNLRFSSPPRRVPFSLIIANAFNVGSQAGWAFFGFGMIFFWAFVGNADLSFINFRGPYGQAQGRITKVERTGASENKTRIYKNYYTYSIADQTLEGISYTLGEQATAGANVAVQYDPNNPLRSRVAGMRRGQFGPFVLFVVIFPAVGLAIAVFATLFGLRRVRLLRDGQLAMGTLKNKYPTNMTVNKRPVYALEFEFNDRNGQRQEVTAKTSMPHRLEDERQEPLLYNPANPSKAYMLDEDSARPKFGQTGELLAAPSAMLRLIVPALVIGLNAWVLYLKMH